MPTGEQVKELARNESLRPRIVLAVESIARNPINAIHRRARLLARSLARSLARKHTLIKGLIAQSEPSRYNCSGYQC